MLWISTFVFFCLSKRDADALVPADGQTVLDLLPEESASGLPESASNSNSGFRVAPAPAEAFAVNAQDRAWVDRRCVDHPLKSFEQPIRLQDNWEQVRRRVYIYATGGSPGVGKPFFGRAQKEAGWQAVSLACGHDVMFDRSDELTRILIESTSV